MADDDWIIATAVGLGMPGFAGDGGPAAQALLNGPFDVGFDPAGNLYLSDTFNHRIRRAHQNGSCRESNPYRPSDWCGQARLVGE